LSPALKYPVSRIKVSSVGTWRHAVARPSGDLTKLLKYVESEAVTATKTEGVGEKITTDLRIVCSSVWQLEIISTDIFG
jgi:hypothetical protein